MPAVCAILVNYFSAPLVARAVQSVLAQGGGLPGALDVRVVDNSADAAEAARLRQMLPPQATLTVNESNEGFARACNRAFAGSRAPFVLLLNPDALLLPGALASLTEILVRDAQAGAAGPRTYWDEGRAFLMPPSTFPSTASLLGDLMARHWPWADRWRSRLFRARAWRAWHTDQPVTVPALSGGHVLLKRAALEAAGGLFDERFFLYWEDSDLMQRLRAAGYRLWLVPQAQAVHAYTHSPEKGRLIGAGWPAYFEKHFAPGWLPWSTLERVLAPAPGAAPWPTLHEAPRDNGDLVLPVPSEWQGGWLLEISPSRDFVPAIGHLGRGPVARVPAALHGRLTGAVYHLRLTPDTRWPRHSLGWQFQN